MLCFLVSLIGCGGTLPSSPDGTPAVTLVSVAVTPASQGMVKNATRQFSATGSYSDGSKKDITASVSWSSLDPSVAVVDSTGKTTSLAAGSTRITASKDGKSSEALLTVTVAAPRPQLLITFDLHADPMSQVQTVDQRRATYQQWVTNAGWLLDTIAPYNARISFLSTGEFLEFCLEDPARDTACFPVLQRLYASGGIFGTHSHLEWHRGAHDWPDFTGTMTDADILRNWDDAKAMVDQAIASSLTVTAPAAIAAINCARGSHAPADTNAVSTLMDSYGYTIHEGGNDQELVKYFGHIPFNPYRPGACNLCEDLGRSWVNLPQSTVLGMIGEHYSVWQDGSAARKQAEILQALVNMRIQSLEGNGEKVWTYGWGAHNSDFDPGKPARDAAQVLIPWISSELVSRGEATFASYRGAWDAYAAWEAAHSGESSFSYTEKTTNYSLYPYSEITNRYFRFARYDSSLAAGGTFAYLLKAGNYSLQNPTTYTFVLAYTDDSVVSLDLSGTFGSGTVTRIRLSDGNKKEMAASSAEATVEPAIFCKAADCAAIAALEDSILTPCGSGPACTIGQVCATDVTPNLCVPDCRIQGNTCPALRPTCDSTSGVCH